MSNEKSVWRYLFSHQIIAGITTDVYSFTFLMMSRVQCCHPFFGVIKNPQKMELSCHFFWLLRPQIEWTIKCHKKKSLGSIKRALEWAIKVESEKPGDSKTYINDTQQQPHLLKRSDGGRKRLLHYTMCQKTSIMFRHFKSLPRWGESKLNKFQPVFASNIFGTCQQRVQSYSKFNLYSN